MTCALRARLWRALTDPAELAAWFGIALDGHFAPGARLTGRSTAPGHEQETIEFTVERVEPERLLAFRWRFHGSQPDTQSWNDPMTLVEFHLADAADGTRLTVIESGFEQVALAWRADLFRLHEQGWADQLARLAGYVAA